MNTDDMMLFLLFATALCVVLALGAWWSDRQLMRSRRRQVLPAPRREAVVGETYKPWM